MPGPRLPGELSPLTTMPYQSPYNGPYMGVGQIPGIGDNPLMQMAGQALGSMTMGAAGMLPLGGGRSNAYGRMNDLALTRLHDDMMRNLADQERHQMMRGARGFFELAGLPWGSEQRRTAGNVVDMVNTFAPTLASAFPDVLDVLGGSRGSALALGEYAFRGGQHRLDPTTGRLGMSGEAVESLVNEVRTSMYDRDQVGATARNVGFSMGAQGQLFADLQRRGMVAGGGRADLETLMGAGERQGRARYSGESLGAWQEATAIQNDKIEKAIRRTYGDKPVPESSPGVIDLAAVQRDRPMLDKVMNDSAMQDVAKEFDSRRIVSTLENYGGAVKAMREIFGDAGNPNAPMSELINALDALTGNSLAQVDPSRVEMMVRSTYALAESTGVGVPGMMMMTQAAAAQAQALGLNPAFANEGVRGALAFRQAVQNQGLAGYSAWGRGGIEDFTQLEQSLQLNAAGSAAANRMGAAMRIRESMAAPGQATPFAADSGVERWLGAVRSGQRSVELDFGDGRGRRRVGSELNDSQFFALMRSSAAQSGIALSDATVAEMMGQRQQNQRLVMEEGLTPIVRNLQVNDAVRRVGVAAQWAASTRVNDLGLDLGREASGRLVGGLAGAVARSVVDLDPEIATDPGRLRRHLARQMQDKLRAAAADPSDAMHAEANQVLDKFRGDTVGMNQWLTGTAESMQGTIDQRLQEQGFYGGLQNLAVMQNRDNLGNAAQNAFRARTTGQIESAMSGFGNGGPLRRAMDAVISGPERPGGTDLLDVLGGMIGGEQAEAVGETLLPVLQNLKDKKKELDDAMAAWEGANEEDRADRAAQVEARTAELDEMIQQVSGTLERNGIRMDAPVESTELQAALRNQQWASERLEELQKGTANLSEFGIDRKTREKVGDAAAAMGVTTDRLMTMDRKELDNLLDGSEAITRDQAAVVRSTRDTMDTQLNKSMGSAKDKAAEMAFRLLDDNRAMTAGGEGLRKAVDQTLNARRKMQILSARAGGDLEAATGADTKEEWAAAEDELRLGTERMQKDSFRSGYGFMHEKSQKRLEDLATKLSSSGIVSTGADVMSLSPEQIKAFEKEGLLNGADVAFIEEAQDQKIASDAEIDKVRKAHTSSANEAMAAALTKMTGKEVEQGAVAEAAEQAGMGAWLEAIKGDDDQSAMARAVLQERAGTVGVLRGVRTRTGLDGKSLESMLYDDEGEARSEAWFRAKGVTGADYDAVKEAQGWDPSERSWLRRDDVEGIPAERDGSMDDLLPTSARTPKQDIAASGSGDYTFKIDRLVLNGKDMGPAEGDGEGDRELESGSANTA